MPLEGGATSEEECSYHFYFAKPTNDLSSREANFNGHVPFGKAPKANYLDHTSRVGAYPPNKLGLCDMHGNAWQWCADSWDSDRVLRGGSWDNLASYCRASYRIGRAPSFRRHNVGFRLVRVPVQPATASGNELPRSPVAAIETSKGVTTPTADK
jgi:formylglycine-generating enzyme required for sulfatase activity